MATERQRAAWPRSRTALFVAAVVALLAALVAVARLATHEGRSDPPAGSGLFATAARPGRAGSELQMRPADVHAMLSRRPLHAPALRDGAYCPDPVSRDARSVPGVPAEAGRGTGPVSIVHPAIPRFLDFFDPSPTQDVNETAGWRGAQVLVVVDRTYRGPVLIRGAYVSPIGFPTAAAGTPRLGFGTAAHPEPELWISTTRWSRTQTPRRVFGRRLRLRPRWRALTAVVRTRREGCYFYQVDGTGFSDRFLFGAKWQ